MPTPRRWRLGRSYLPSRGCLVVSRRDCSLRDFVIVIGDLEHESGWISEELAEAAYSTHDVVQLPATAGEKYEVDNESFSVHAYYEVQSSWCVCHPKSMS